MFLQGSLGGLRNQLSAWKQGDPTQSAGITWGNKQIDLAKDKEDGL